MTSHACAVQSSVRLLAIERLVSTRWSPRHGSTVFVVVIRRPKQIIEFNFVYASRADVSLQYRLERIAAAVVTVRRASARAAATADYRVALVVRWYPVLVFDRIDLVRILIGPFHATDTTAGCAAAASAYRRLPDKIPQAIVVAAQASQIAARVDVVAGAEADDESGDNADDGDRGDHAARIQRIATELLVDASAVYRLPDTRI